MNFQIQKIIGKVQRNQIDLLGLAFSKSTIMSALNMNPIVNLDKYTSSMKTTLSDKLFFTELIESDIYVDFGCADGSTLKALQNKIFILIRFL